MVRVPHARAMPPSSKDTVECVERPESTRSAAASPRRDRFTLVDDSRSASSITEPNIGCAAPMPKKK